MHQFRKTALFSLLTLVWVSGCNRNVVTQSEISADQDHVHPYKEINFYDGISDKLLFPSKSPDRVILNLTENPLTSVAVNWRTNSLVKNGFVEVTDATPGPDFSKSPRTIEAITEYLESQHDDEPRIYANYHSAIIDGLEKGQKYLYRVGADEAWSEWFQFQMPDPDEKGLSFVYFGDAQNDIKSMWSRVIREAYKTEPQIDFMLHAGDLINRYDRDIEWGEWFYAGGYLHAIVPSIMTPGNHEYHGLELSPQWRPQFTLPKNGVKGLEEVNYVINYPDVQVISLDSKQIDQSKESREAQKQWLDSVLTNNKKTWTVVTFHYPVFSTNPRRDNKVLRESLKPVFDKHKVDIVLQGHDHAYGRGAVTNVPTGATLKDDEAGTMYVVSVSGPKMYDVSDDSWMERKAAKTQLFQLISIKGDVLSYEAFSADGVLYDAFDLKKNPGSLNTLINKIPDIGERK